MIVNDAFEGALHLAARLEAAQVPYAIGGALAYGQYGIPRATNDIDVNIFLAPDALQPALTALADAGVTFDVQAAQKDAVSAGAFIGHLGSFRVDVFVPSVPFSWEAGRTRRRFELGAQSVYFLAPEALCVFKLLFFRGKDLVDLERLLAVMGGTLDVAVVRRHIAEMMGEDDARVVAWDRIVREGRGAS